MRLVAMKSFPYRRRKFLGGLFTLALLLLLPVPLVRGADHPLYFVAPDAVDVLALLPPPPIAGSPEDRADMAAVVNARNSCPANDLAVALEQNQNLSVFNLAPFLGANFKADQLPKTALLIYHAQRDTAWFVNLAKDHWRRPRPSTTDPSLLDAHLRTLNFSYPSGHSASATIMALILMDLVPDHAQDKSLPPAATPAGIACNWRGITPSDIQAAGRVLAQAAYIMSCSPIRVFKPEFAEAKAGNRRQPFSCRLPFRTPTPPIRRWLNRWRLKR